MIQKILTLGAKVMTSYIPDNIIKELNDYVDEVILNKNLLKELDHGSKLAGDITQEIELPTEFLEKSKWPEYIGDRTAEYIRDGMGAKMNKFHLISTWVVRSFNNDFNPVHWHGGHVSGVGFLKVPSTQKYTDAKGNDKGRLELITGQRHFMSQSTCKISPKVGGLVIFPNWMMHTAYPSSSNEERRTISFNAQVDNTIYDVYANTHPAKF
jgi:hypothetical protein|tara:strand:+ start:705 stop:1337 length:633 start_codon:yes stop_codon:yes gene_type:complete